ncbi:MAG: hypothetical protein HKN92_06260 [Chitinophagales bacterium]|nr:hypothetical protein [Chitinophagales bacterium]
MTVKHIKVIAGIVAIGIGLSIFFVIMNSISVSIWVLLFSLFLIITGIQFILDSIEVHD